MSGEVRYALLTHVANHFGDAFYRRPQLTYGFIDWARMRPVCLQNP